jgi:uncharacterized membrane protein YuzA (DUF378 family)
MGGPSSGRGGMWWPPCLFWMRFSSALSFIVGSRPFRYRAYLPIKLNGLVLFRSRGSGFVGRYFSTLGTDTADRLCRAINTEKNMRALNVITHVLVIIGGLNWGLVGLFDFDLVSAILGNGAAETATSSAASRIVYILVALSALYQLVPFARTLADDRRGVAQY